MADDLESLINHLAIWSAADYGGESLRVKAIAALKERKPQAVPALIQRLEELLDAAARHRERLAELLRAWDAWYSEGHKLYAEHGPGVDIEPYRTVRTESLPPASIRDEYRDPVHLKQGIIEALHQLGDPRAGAVIVSALADRVCVSKAARALRDIRCDQAVPALLDAAARVQPHDSDFTDVLGTLNDYGLSPAQVRERFEAETVPQGRVSLWHLLSKLDKAGDQTPPMSVIRDSLVFLTLDRNHRTIREASIALREIDRLPAPEFQSTDMGEFLPPPDIIASAIALAAHGRPPGHDHVLLGNLRRVGHTPQVKQAAEAVLTQRPPETDTPQLYLALEFILGVSPRKLNDPMELIRALDGLTSHSDSQIRARALTALLRDDLLFTQMLQEDGPIRQEAISVFESIAGPHDRTRFTKYAKSLRTPFWRKLLRR